MHNTSREEILRMVGLHDSAQFMRQINAIQLSLEEQDGQMVAYWTEIRKDERQITLVAGRVSANETSIGQLQVTAQQLTASVSSLSTTVSGHTTSIGQLQVTANSISNRVTVIEGDYVKEAEISLMVKKDGNGYISNASIKADNIDFTFTRSTNFISNGTTVMNINSSGDLWILGDYKGGSITGNITIGTGTNKMYIRPNEADGAELVGFNGNTQLIELGFYSVSGGGSSTYLVLGEKAAYLSKWVELKWEGLKFGGGPYYGMHPTTYKVKIGGTWPTAASQVDVGEVYLDNGYLKVRTS